MKQIFWYQLFAAVVLVSSQVQAQNFRYRHCETLTERRTQLNGNDVCFLQLRCQATPSTGGRSATVEFARFCRPDTLSQRCPRGEGCVADDSFSAEDIKVLQHKITQSEVSIHCPPTVGNSPSRGAHR